MVRFANARPLASHDMLLTSAMSICYSQGLKIDPSLATPIGMGCKVCERPDCPQRAFPPVGRALNVDETRSYFAPYATSR